MNEEIETHHKKYPYNYSVSSLEVIRDEKRRIYWILTNDKEDADMVWNNGVKDYEGAFYYNGGIV